VKIELVNRALAVKMLDRERLSVVADGMAAAVVVSLPWSTSATSILLVLWLIALVPTLDLAAVRRELLTAAGGMPVLFCLLAAIGMLWADATLAERFKAFGAFGKLAVVPLLLAQFRRSGNIKWVTKGFVISCSILLALSYAFFLLWHEFNWFAGHVPGVPVKDYITQNGAFQLCIFGMAHVAIDAWRLDRRRLALALAALIVLFVANIAYVATGRTVLVVMPVLLILFGLRQLGWKGTVALLAGFAVLAAVLWVSSPYLRARVDGVRNEIQLWRTLDANTSSGERLEFWRKSMIFIARAPVIGHGTGSIQEQFRGAVGSGTGPSSIASANPHQQIFAVAIQLGAVGVIVLLALWIAHLRLFIGESGLAAWCGLSVVVQNVASSMFNSHLFDFTQGWMYVFGVGIFGGALMHEQQLIAVGIARQVVHRRG